MIGFALSGIVLDECWLPSCIDQKHNDEEGEQQEEEQAGSSVGERGIEDGKATDEAFAPRRTCKFLRWGLLSSSSPRTALLAPLVSQGAGKGTQASRLMNSASHTHSLQL